jgi:predicted nucleic acid-binding protein
MNAVKAFVDTNILIYLYSGTDEQKRRRAYLMLNQYDCQISTQVLNEFSNVCIRKWKSPMENIRRSIDKICSYCDISYIDESTIAYALEVHEKYKYSYYDSLIIASAFERDCQYLFSEDMSDGQILGGRLTIRNIFAHEEI